MYVWACTFYTKENEWIRETRPNGISFMIASQAIVWNTYSFQFIFTSIKALWSKVRRCLAILRRILRVSIIDTFGWVIWLQKTGNIDTFVCWLPLHLVDERCLKASTVSVFVYDFSFLNSASHHFQLPSWEICTQFQIFKLHE